MELSFNANTGTFVFYEDGNGVRVGWMKASIFPWHAALFSGSALRCGLMDQNGYGVHNIMGDARNQPEFSYFS